ncbi:BQ5605_C002g01304 [Microbotryum silenes-dioicae]|uniref:BQ5605_C002g01304 protein n=1 Tax=Microbotryum silenes-dioicae TaxID=796604 RepID=A0A2X0NVZ9_9BASI|nr:BQ5605_C002g01304 [Microbotryum silenes-dioicae]
MFPILFYSASLFAHCAAPHSARRLSPSCSTHADIMVTANLTEAPLASPTCSIRLTDLIGTKPVTEFR